MKKLVLIMLVYSVLLVSCSTGEVENNLNNSEVNTVIEAKQYDETIQTDVAELKRISILDNKINVLLPSSFGIMDDEMMKLKYPYETRSPLVYTNDLGSINISFNHTQNKANLNTIESYAERMKKVFLSAYPTAIWHGEGVVELNNKIFAYVKLTTPALDTEIYNSIFATDLDGRLLLISFNCIEEDMDDWLETSELITNSIRILE